MALQRGFGVLLVVLAVVVWFGHFGGHHDPPAPPDWMLRLIS
jgi:hypothetical protein